MKEEINSVVAAFRRGELFEGLSTVPGWVDVYIPHLRKLLEKADHDVHDMRIKETTMKERNGYYRGLLTALNLGDEILKEKLRAEKYIKDHHIII